MSWLQISRVQSADVVADFGFVRAEIGKETLSSKWTLTTTYAQSLVKIPMLSLEPIVKVARNEYECIE